MRELFLAWRSLIVTALIAFALGIGAGYWLHGSVQGASETVVAKAETRTVQADAVAAVDSAQQKDAALAKRQDDIQAQTNDALKKVAQYAKRPATPARSTAPASASARDPADPHAIQPEMCWADQHLSVGTVSVLNSARAGVPIDSAALPGDAEGRAYSAITAGDLIDTNIVDAGRYNTLAASHNELVDFVDGLLRRQREALGRGD